MSGDSHEASTAGGVLKRASGSGFRFLQKVLPSAGWADASLRTMQFWRANGRLPRRASDPNATFNDFIIERMRKDDWNILERMCIDKEHAKIFAVATCPPLKAIATLRVIHLSRPGARTKLCDYLHTHAGRPEVAKPTHGSGSVLFLRDSPSDEAIKAFCDAAESSYYGSSRESQYKGLKPKVIIEEDISSTEGPPEDYKFFCSYGEILFCQIDVDRFVGHRRCLVTPEFKHLDVRFSHDLPDKSPRKPENFEEMSRIAQCLSRSFCFVRIDLYSFGGAVYFGEFTFAPEGGAGSLSSEAFGVQVMSRMRAIWRRQEEVDECMVQWRER